MTNILRVILAILAFGFLIIVHEFGHFITAKKSGVRVNEFWLGMGPVLFHKQIGETDYSLRLLPFGGAVVMEGEDQASDDERSFDRAKWGNRFLIVAAGALMNFMAGFLILLFLWLPVQQVGSCQIESFADGFQYRGESMLLEGDEILKINGYHILINSDITIALTRYGGEPMDIQVLRDGKKVTLTDVPLKTNIFLDENGKEVERYGLNFAVQQVKGLDHIKLAFYNGVDFARLVWSSLGDLVAGRVSVNDMSGPVGVTDVLADSVKQSIKSFFMLVSFISINLGVMNLLPIPALDGGRLFFMLIEAVRGGRKIDPKYEGYVHAAGLFLLLGLMVYVTGHDIWRLLSNLI